MIDEKYLAERTAGNGSFSRSVPGLQVQWDSTSLTSMKECPRKYYYTMIEGCSREGNPHLLFGQYLHSSLEHYDKCRAEGLSHEDAEDSTLDYLLKITGEYVSTFECMDCAQENKEPKCSRCGNADESRFEETKTWTPWESTDENKTRFNLVRSVMWYLDYFKNDPAKTLILANGKPAVELSFRFETDLASPDGPYMMCGHMDRVVLYNDLQYVLDRKTTKSTVAQQFFDGFNPHNQFTLYTFASHVVLDIPAKGVIIDAVQVAKGFSRFQRGITTRTPGQLEEWYADTLTLIKSAERYAEARYWPMNDTSCDKFGGCPFRSICKKDPKVRDAFLKTEFPTRRVWDPSQAR